MNGSEKIMKKLVQFSTKMRISSKRGKDEQIYTILKIRFLLKDFHKF
jgi:hypothetical protein